MNPPTRMNTSRKTLRFILAGSILATMHAEAITYTWDGGNASGNWSNAGAGGNWSGGVVPVSSNTAADLVFASNTNGQISANNLATNPFAFLSMTFNSGLPTFSLSGTNPFSVGTQSYINDLSANNVTISAAFTLGLSNNQNFTLINNGAGLLTLSNTLTSTGGAVTAQTLNITGSGNVAISGQIAQSGALFLEKTGSGTLTLSGASNQQSGRQDVLQGTLTLDYSTNNNNKMAATAPVSLGGNYSTIISTGSAGPTGTAQTPVAGVAAGGTLNIVGSSGAATAQTVGGITTNTGASTVNVISNNAGGATLTTGTITHLAANFGGTVNFGLTNNAGTAVVNVSNANVNGTIGGWATLGLNDFVSGGGNIAAATYTNQNDESLWAASQNISDNGVAYTGTTNSLLINSLRFNAAAASTVNIAGGQTLQVGNTTHTVGGILITSNVGANNTGISGGQLTATIAAGANNPHELIIHQNNTLGTFTITSSIINNPGQTNSLSVTKSGAGTLILSGTNTFNGTFYQNAGETQLGASAMNGTPALVMSGGTLTLGGNSTTFGNYANGPVGLAGAAGTLQNASVTPVTLTIVQQTTGTFGGAIVDGVGGGALSLTKKGGASLILTGANTYTGTVNVNGGTLVYAADANLAGAATINLSNSDRIAGGAAVLNNTAAISNWARLVNIDASQKNLLVGFNTGGNLTFNSSGTRGITGGNSSTTIIKSGTGTLTLTNATTADYIGNWRLDAGTLSLSGVDETRLGNVNNGILFNGGTVANSSSGTDLNFASTRTLTLLLQNITGNAAGNTFSTGGTNGGIIIDEANQLTGLGGFTKTSTGTMNISASQNFGGYQTVSVTGGTLKVNSDSALGVSSNLLSLNAGTLQLGAAFDTARIMTLAGGTTTIDTNGFNMIASGIVNGANALTKAGAGILTLSGTNNYSGATTVSAGTLKLSGATAANGTVGPLGVGSAVTVSTGGILDLNGNNTTVGNLAGTTGEIKLGGGALTTGLNTGGTTFTGQITGSGSLTKLGTGTQTLQGDNTFAGTVTITNGSGSNITLSGASASGKLSGVTAIIAGGGGNLQAGSSTNSENTAARVNSAATLTLGDSTLGSGSFTLGLGNATLTQNLATVTLNAGLDSLTTLNSGTGAQKLVFNGAGTLLTRNSGSALFVSSATNFLVNFSNAGGGTVPTNTNNILGGYAFIGGSNNTSNSAVTDFASIDGSNNLVAGPQGGYNTVNAIGSWAANQNITNTAAWTGSVAASVAINSLRIANNASGTVNIDSGQTLTLASGGLLNSSTAATGTQLIAAPIGTADLTSGNGSDLIVYQSGASALTFGTGLRISGSIGLTIVKTGGGAVTLGGGSGDTVANTYNGTTTVINGAVALSKAANTVVIPGDLSIFGGGTVTLAATTAGQIATGSNVNLRGGTLNLNSNAVTLSSLNYQTGAVVSNIATSGAGLTLAGNGAVALTLGNNNTALGAGTNTIFLTGTSGGGIRYNGFSSTATVAAMLDLGSPVTPFQRVVNVDDGNQASDLAISGTIAGTNGLEKTGLGRLDLTTATNGFSGGIKISNGVLGADADARLGAAANSIVLNGGAFRANGNFGTLGAGRTITVNNVGGNVIDTSGLGNNNDVTLGTVNQLTGSGSLLVVGNNSTNQFLNLSAVQNYSGALTIGGNVVNYGAYTTGGSVKLTASGALGSVSSITLNNNALLRNDFAGTQTFGAGVPLAFTGNATINTNNGSIIFNGAVTASAQGLLSLAGNNTLQFNGAVTGSGGFTTNVTSGILRFSVNNASSMTGPIYVPSGTVQADVAGALGTGTVFMGRITSTAGGTLALGGATGFTLSNNIVISASPVGTGNADRATITAPRTGPGLGNDATGQIYTVSGNISGNNGLVVDRSGAATAPPEVAFSGNLTWSGSTQLAQNSGGTSISGGPGSIGTQTAFVRFTDPTKLPSGGQNNVTSYHFAMANGNSAGADDFAGYVFQTNATPYTFANTATGSNAAYKFAIGGLNFGSGPKRGVLGSAGTGTSTLRADALIVADGTNNIGLTLLARDSSTLALGDATQPIRFIPAGGTADASGVLAQVNSAATTFFDVAATRTLIKRGEGTISLGNVQYTNIAGTALNGGNPTTGTSAFTWQIGRAAANSNAGANVNFDGAVRGRSTFNEDGTATLANSLFSGAASGNFVLQLRGGVYEIDANGASPRVFTAALGSAANAAPQVNWGAGGGGFSAFGGPVTVTVTGTTANWASTTNFLGNGESLVFGSNTADNVVTFTRDFGLASNGNVTATREIRVLDNTGSATDRAVLSGNIYDSQAAGGGSQSGGTGTRGLLKSGAGSLELRGTGSTYNGTTILSQGTLLVGGNVPVQGAGTGVLGQPAVGSDTIGINDANTGANNTALLINGAFTMDRPVTVSSSGSGTVTIGGNSDDNSTFSGVITLNRNVRITSATTGTNRVTLSGTMDDGVGSFSVTKVGAGTVDFAVGSIQTYDALVAQQGTTNVNSAVGTGSSSVSVTGAGTTLKFGTVSQTLSSLTIGDGSTVVLTSGLASFTGGSGGGEAPDFGGGFAAVPEPGTIGLLLVGALGLLNRRRR